MKEPTQNQINKTFHELIEFEDRCKANGQLENALDAIILKGHLAGIFINSHLHKKSDLIIEAERLIHGPSLN